MLTDEDIGKIKSIKWCIEELCKLVRVVETRHTQEDIKIIAWHHTEMVCELLVRVGREQYDDLESLQDTYWDSLRAAGRYFTAANEDRQQATVVTENAPDSPKFEGGAQEI